MPDGALGHAAKKFYDINYDIFMLYLGLAHVAKQTKMNIHSSAHAEIKTMLLTYA